MRRWLVAAALLLSTAAGAAPADPRPRKVASAAVALDRRLEVEAAKVDAILRGALQNDSRFEAVDLNAKALGESRALQAQKAAALTAEALNLLDEMNEKGAAQKASQAVAAYEAADLTSAMGGLLDALATRAFALHSAGDKAGARAELGRIFTIKADYKLDPRRVAPDLAQLAEDVRGKASRARRVALAVQSSPVPAEVFVDGVFRGVAPLEVSDLASGSHYVTLRAPGYDLAQVKQVAGLGAPASLALKPAPGAARLLALLHGFEASRPPGGDGSGAELARWAGADEALVVGLHKKDDATWAMVTRFDPEGRSLAALDEPLPTPAAIEDLAHRALLKAAEPAVPVAPPAPPAIAEARPRVEPPAPQLRRAEEARVSVPVDSSRRTWGWVAAGAGAAALAGGVVMGIMANGKAADARASSDSSAYQSSRDSAKTLALGSDVLYGVAAVGAGTALWLLLTGDQGPGGSAGSGQGAARLGPADGVGLAIAPAPGGAAVSISGAF